MNTAAPTLNLLLAWMWIGLGFASGALLGLRIAREGWLGGYASFRRRMYRLGHISFFGLGFVNLAFYLTARASQSLPAALLDVASATLGIGALAMPVCCLVMAHWPNASPPALFALPVGTLLTGGFLTLWMLLKL